MEALCIVTFIRFTVCGAGRNRYGYIHPVFHPQAIVSERFPQVQQGLFLSKGPGFPDARSE